MDKKKDDGKGWVSIHRSIQDHWLYDDRPFNYSMAWIDMVLSCNHSDNKILFNRNPITIERGQMLTSIRNLADRWGWGRDKVARFLKLLESDGMIIKESDSKRTLITLVNYDFFQGCAFENRTVNGHRSDTDKATDTAQTIMNNNVNNENKNNSASKHFKAPSVEEVQRYCRERGNNVDAERFIDYYSARGWELKKGQKMKDWKAAIRTWEKNNETWGESSKGEKYDSKQRELYRDFF